MTTTPETIPGTFESLTVANKLAAEVLRKTAIAVDEAARAGGYPVPKRVFAAYEQAAEAVHATAVRLALIAPCGASVETADGRLTVAERDDAPFTVKAVLTEDGKPVIRTWHEGPEAGPNVQYAVYTEAGRVAHGWVDRKSRKITQTG